MSTQALPDSILSFRDIPPHRSRRPNHEEVAQGRLLYKPSHDLQFDLEMQQRHGEQNSKTEPFQQPLSYGDDEEANKSGERTNPTEVEFGSRLDTENLFDEETLNSLLLPPSPEYYPGFERELRSNAIYFYNRSVGLLKTDQIISHVIQTVNTRDLNFEHLEWIDDFSCVLAFADQSAAIGALTTLLLNPDEIEGENGLAEAIDYLSSTAPVPPSGDVLAAAAEFVFTLRPSKPLASTLFDNGQPNALLHPTRPEMLVPFVRFASTFDVKRRNAKDHSLFYTLNGQRAGRDRVQAGHAPSLPRSSKRRRNMDSAGGSVDQSHRWSHAEHDEEPSLHSRLMARLPASRRGDGPDRRRAVAMAADLDDELDRFMSRGSTSGIAGEELGRPAEDGSEDEYAPEYRPMKRHEPEEVEQFAKEDLFPRSRLGVGGGNLDLFPLESHEIKQPQSPSEDPLRTWIVQSDARDEGHEEEELGPDEELVDEYVEMIDEETGKKIKRLTQSRRRKNRGLSYGRLI